MKDFRQAQTQIVKSVKPLEGEAIALKDAVGRVLMNEIRFEEENTITLGESGRAAALRLLRPALTGLLLSGNCQNVIVKKKPRVTLIIHDHERDNAILQYLHFRCDSLNAVLKEAGAGDGVSRDVIESLAAESEVIIVVGGEQKELFNQLKEAGDSLLFSKLDIDPAGEAFAYDIDGTHVIGCPSTFPDLLVTMELLVVPHILSRQQIVDSPDAALKAELRADIKVEGSKTVFVPGKSNLKAGVLQVMPIRDWQSMSEKAFVDADCLIVADPEQFVLDHYSIVDIISLDRGLV